MSCATKPILLPNNNAVNDPCPYKPLNYTEATSADSYSSTKNFIDSLKILADPTLQNNSLTASNDLKAYIKNHITQSKTSKFQFGPEYIEVFNSYVAIMCGANANLNRYKDTGNEQFQEEYLKQMRQATEYLLSYDKKKQ